MSYLENKYIVKCCKKFNIYFIRLLEKAYSQIIYISKYINYELNIQLYGNEVIKLSPLTQFIFPSSKTNEQFSGKQGHMGDCGILLLK